MSLIAAEESLYALLEASHNGSLVSRKSNERITRLAQPKSDTGFATRP
ncbi:MAG: hypothetical protein ACYC2H_11315 [Thermoplasmatota archaeon]